MSKIKAKSRKKQQQMNDIIIFTTSPSILRLNVRLKRTSTTKTISFKRLSIEIVGREVECVPVYVFVFVCVCVCTRIRLYFPMGYDTQHSPHSRTVQ